MNVSNDFKINWRVSTPTMQPSKLKERLSDSKTSDISKARELRRGYSQYVQQKQKEKQTIEEYDTTYDEYLSKFDTYQKERDEYIGALSNPVDESIIDKEEEEFLKSYDELMGTTTKLETYGDDSKLKSFKQDIQQEKTSLLSDKEQLGQYKEELVSDIKSYTPTQRYEIGDPTITFQESYRNQWFYEDTGKRVNGQPVYKVVDYRYEGKPYDYVSTAKMQVGKEFINIPQSGEELGMGRKSNVRLVGTEFRGQPYTTVSTSFNPFTIQGKGLPQTDWQYVNTVLNMKIGAKSPSSKITLPAGVSWNYYFTKREPITKDLNTPKIEKTVAPKISKMIFINPFTDFKKNRNIKY